MNCNEDVGLRQPSICEVDGLTDSLSRWITDVLIRCPAGTGQSSSSYFGDSVFAGAPLPPT
jgi:hypothetical protein